MADYYPVLARAVAGLDPNTSENRREVYERARKALVQQLRSYEPPLSESDITRERLSLEDAVRRIEAEARPHPPQPAPPPRPAASAPSGPAAKAAAPPPAAAAGSAAAQPAAPLGPPPAPPATPSSPGPAKTEAPAASAAVQAAASPPPRPDTPFGPPELRRSRWPAIAAGIVVLVVAAIGGGAYVARDQLSDMLTATPPPAKVDAANAQRATPPKIVERVGGGDGAAPAAAPAAKPAANAAADNTTVARLNPAPAHDETPAGSPPAAAAQSAQRAILYEETPDRQSGSAFVGTATWSIDDPKLGPSHDDQTALVAEVTIPERKLQLKLTIKRNTDKTLPASHTIDLQFTLPSDFANGGIANVPGILFKPTEEAGGQALAALSVRVMNNFFLIGLSNNPAEETRNLAAMRDNGWIDLPILYENGRRAVLTLGKGATGTKAFQQALAAWQQEAVAANEAPKSSPPSAGGESGAGAAPPAATQPGSH